MYFEVTHPNTNPAAQGLTSLNICFGKLSEAFDDREVAGELENAQHVSLEANVSPFPFIFFNLSGFSILLVTTCLLRGLFTKHIYHGTKMTYDTKTISCTIRATYYAKTTWISWKTKRSSGWQWWNKGLCYCIITRRQCVHIFSQWFSCEYLSLSPFFVPLNLCPVKLIKLLGSRMQPFRASYIAILASKGGISRKWMVANSVPNKAQSKKMAQHSRIPEI